MALTPDVGVNFKVHGLDQVQRGLRIVKDEAEPTSRRWGTASRQIAGGLEQVARQGKLTGESLKSIISNGAEMAFMFGAGGPIVAALAITGVAIFENITGNIKKAREETVRFQETIAGFRRSGNLAGASDAAQQLFSGDRFAVRGADEDARTFEARQLGILGIRSKIAGLPQGPGGLFSAGSKEQDEVRKWNAILSDYTSRHKLAIAAVNELAAAEGNRLAVLRALFLGDLKATPTGVLSSQQIGGPGGLTRFLDEIVTAKGRGKGGDLSGIAVRGAARPENSPASQAMVESMKSVGEMAGRGFVDTLASTIEAGMVKVFEKGATIGGVFAAMGQAALGGIGSMLSQIGRATLASFAIIEKIKTAFMTLNPVVGIAASLGLIALGAALQGAGARVGANSGGRGGGGYGGGGAYSSSAGYGGSIVDRGVIDPTRGSGVNARSANNYSFTIIGTNDPKAQSDILKMITQAERRGAA